MITKYRLNMYLVGESTRAEIRARIGNPAWRKRGFDDLRK
jgi:hypothetical protein